MDKDLQYQKEVIAKLKGLIYILPDELPTEPFMKAWYRNTLKLAESQISKLLSETKL